LAHRRLRLNRHNFLIKIYGIRSSCCAVDKWPDSIHYRLRHLARILFIESHYLTKLVVVCDDWVADLWAFLQVPRLDHLIGLSYHASCIQHLVSRTRRWWLICWIKSATNTIKILGIKSLLILLPFIHFIYLYLYIIWD